MREQLAGVDGRVARFKRCSGGGLRILSYRAASASGYQAFTQHTMEPREPLPCMRFDASPPALASPAPPLPAIADIPTAHIVIILADSGTLL